MRTIKAEIELAKERIANIPKDTTDIIDQYALRFKGIYTRKTLHQLPFIWLTGNSARFMLLDLSKETIHSRMEISLQMDKDYLKETLLASGYKYIRDPWRSEREEAKRNAKRFNNSPDREARIKKIMEEYAAAENQN